VTWPRKQHFHAHFTFRLASHRANARSRVVMPADDGIDPIVRDRPYASRAREDPSVGPSRGAVAVGRLGEFGWDLRVDAPKTLEVPARALDRRGADAWTRRGKAWCVRAFASSATTAAAVGRERDAETRFGNNLVVVSLGNENRRKDARRRFGALILRGEDEGGIVAEKCSFGDVGCRVTAEARMRMRGNVMDVDATKTAERKRIVVACQSRASVGLFEVDASACDEVKMVRVACEDAAGSDVLGVRVNPVGMTECAYATAGGTLGILDADGARRIDSPASEDASYWYGVGYSFHPRLLLHASTSAVYSVDVRTNRRETRRLHLAPADEAIASISSVKEHLYALATSSTRGSSRLTKSYVEMRDARRASEPIVRWEHQGGRVPTSLRIFDSSGWHRGVKANQALGIYTSGNGASCVHVYECEKIVDGLRGQSGVQMRPLSYGTSVPFAANHLRGFDATKIGPWGGLFWVDDYGVHVQRYDFQEPKDSRTSATLLRALYFEKPDVDASREKPARITSELSNRATERVAKNATFDKVPHLYDYIVHGKAPSEIDVSRDSNDEAENARVLLHQTFSDGWTMNGVELLDTAEFLSGSSTAADLVEWRCTQRKNGHTLHAASDRWRKKRSDVEPIPNPINRVALAADVSDSFASDWLKDEDMHPDVALALAHHASRSNDAVDKYTRRLILASRLAHHRDRQLLDMVGSECGDARESSRHARQPRSKDASSIPFLDSQSEPYSQDSQDPFITQLRTQWHTPDKRRRYDADIGVSMPPPPPRPRRGI